MIASNNVVRCQQCAGAAVPVPGKEYMQCEYCLSLIFSTDNPLSIDRITPLDGHMDALCPVCEQDLCKGQIEDRPVLYCCGCYGMLVKNEHFGAIVRERRARRRGCEAESCRPLRTEEYDRSVNCPNCRGLMEVHPYYGPGNIVIDSCHACQFIWLDHGELRTVERVEGGAEPQSLPLHFNSEGEVTIIPPPPQKHSGHNDENSPLGIVADLIFGLR